MRKAKLTEVVQVVQLLRQKYGSGEVIAYDKLKTVRMAELVFRALKLDNLSIKLNQMMSKFIDQGSKQSNFHFNIKPHDGNNLAQI